jgi:predicted metal-binding protein
MSAERWAVTLGCPECVDALCEPLSGHSEQANKFTPSLSVQTVVRCTECAHEFLLTVELAPLRNTKTNDGLTASKPRIAPTGRSIYETEEAA